MLHINMMHLKKNKTFFTVPITSQIIIEITICVFVVSVLMTQPVFQFPMLLCH